MLRAPEPELDQAFFALSDPTRRRLLEQLGARESTVSDLAGPHAMSLPAISKHLRVLEQAGLLSRRVQGREHFLRATPEPLERMQRWIDTQRAFWEGSFDRLAEHLDRLARETNAPPPEPRKLRKPRKQ